MIKRKHKILPKKTKFDSVIEWVNRRQNFTWKEFISSMKCSYPSGETNYLRMLVTAGYVNKVSRGNYLVVYTSSGITLSKLREESILPGYTIGLDDRRPD